MKVGVIEGIDIGSEALAQGSGQFALIADGGNGLEVRAQGSEAFRSMAASSMYEL
jgi:hypothetical protein